MNILDWEYIQFVGGIVAGVGVALIIFFIYRMIKVKRSRKFVNVIAEIELAHKYLQLVNKTLQKFHLLFQEVEDANR